MRRGGIELYFFISLFILIIIASMTVVIMESKQYEPVRPEAKEELADHQAHMVLMNVLRTSILNSVSGQSRYIMMSEVIALDPEVDLTEELEMRIPPGYDYQLKIEYPSGKEVTYGSLETGAIATTLLPSDEGNIQLIFRLEEET